ncbi:MAG: uroporphyrinogen decarboxylase family protein [Nitrososphaeria archaeon]
MNHRERFFKALELKEPDYVPITDLALDPPIVESILQRKVGKTVLTMAGGSDSWESSIDYRLSMVEACKRLDFDAVPALSDYSLTTKTYQPKYIDGKRYIDHWGRIMQTSEESKSTYFVGGTVNSLEDLEEYQPPDAFHPDIVDMARQIIKKIKDDDIVSMAQCHSGWHMAFQVRGGIDKISVDFYRNPKLAKALFDKIAKACQKFAECMIEAGVEVLFVTDDYADTKGPMINPRLFREYELPNLQEIVNIGKRHGIPVLKHSDGNLYPILDDIVNTGVKCIHPIEPGAMDLGDVKERYGRMVCLAGNVDCRFVLPFGSESDVRKDVRRCIDSAAKDGGFILASSNSLHANVKVENIYAMVDEARKYGKYPLRGVKTTF